VRGDGGSTLSAQRDERTLLERHSGFGREAQARVAEPGLLSDGITIIFWMWFVSCFACFGG
jgi:hypothetical protein